MAEEESGGSGIEGMISRKVGPLPLYAWVMIAGGVGFIIFRMRGGSSGGSSNPGQGNTFSSQQQQSGTTPTGGQYSSSYSAQGNGYLPGMLTYGAGNMPTSEGDVYVNYPAQAAQPTPSTGQQPIYRPGTTSGFNYTTPRDMYPQEVAQHAYNLSDYNGKPDAVSLAYDAVFIALANPGVAWGNNDLIPAGTKLFIPGAPPDLSKQGSTWDNFNASDNYTTPPATVPVPQQSTVASNTPGVTQ